MYPRFRDVARIAAEVGGLSTTVCTNATLVRRREADLFAALGINVHVSIDGEPTYHNSFRAVAGAFREAERGVKLLIQAGVPVTIVTTVSKQNLRSVRNNCELGY